MLLVVDESQGIRTEHGWVPDMVQELDAALMNLGLGESSSTPNLFGLVGYGEMNVRLGSVGRTLTLDDGQTMYSSSQLAKVARMLKKYGGKEDGYQAMEHALQKLQLRNSENIEQIMILITDEDRDVVTPQGKEITRKNMRKLLKLKDIALHVVVGQHFYTVDGRPAFGMNSSEWAFVQTKTDSVEELPRARKGFALGSTEWDYTNLALRLNGTAWDFWRIGKEGPERALFTHAVTRVVAAQTFHVST